MINKRKLVVSLFQLIVGLFAIVSFAIVGLGGEDMARWIVTLVLAVAYAVLGIVGLFDLRSDK